MLIIAFAVNTLCFPSSFRILLQKLCLRFFCYIIPYAYRKRCYFLLEPLPVGEMPDEQARSPCLQRLSMSEICQGARGKMGSFSSSPTSFPPHLHSFMLLLMQK